MVGCLLSMDETLSSAYSTEKKKKVQSATARETGNLGEKRKVCVGLGGYAQARGSFGR